MRESNRRRSAVAAFVLSVLLPAGTTRAESSLRFEGNGVAAPALDRVTIRIDAPARPADLGGDFTLELWMRARPGENGASGCAEGRDGWTGGNILVDRDVLGDGDFGDFGVSLFDDGLAFGVSRGTSGGGLCTSQNRSGRFVDLADDRWHHVALTRRKSDGLLRAFIDGRLEAESAGPAGDVSYRNGRASTAPADPFLVIGAEKHDAGAPFLSFRGWIDEIRLSKKIRHTGAFTPRRAPFKKDSATVALYHLDEGQGDRVGDSSGASGGPSDGVRRYGGSPAGPEWSLSNPMWPVIALEPVASGLDRPLHLTHAGDGGDRLFVVEQPGRIRILRDGVLVPAPFLDISALVGCCGERGLLSVAFSPVYGASGGGRFYVDYTNLDGDTVIALYRASADPDVADPASAEILLTIDQPYANHNGGQLAFGPDGYLYVAMGDGGSGGDPHNHAQNKQSLLGKILRIDVESGVSPYAVPADNPFVGVKGDDRIWALGLRNPWRLSFDRATGDLYLGDVGQTRREEIDFEPASSRTARNYGWRILEGGACYKPASGCTPPPAYSKPVAQYDHSKGCSVTGGFVYRGELASLYGVYFYADYCSGRIWGLRKRDAKRWITKELLDTDLRISSFGEDEDGEIYVVGHGGSIHRLVEAGP